MSNYNRFGVVSLDCINRFKVNGYAPELEEFGGDESITPIIDNITDEVAAALGNDVFLQLFQPEKVQLVRKAITGQTAFKVPACMLPIVPGSMCVWWGALIMFQNEPRRRSEYGTSFGTNGTFMDMGATRLDDRWSSGALRLFELNDDQYTYDVTTGVCSLAGGTGPMGRDDLIYASWNVDNTGPTYALTGPNGTKSLASIANVIIDGVAGVIGSRAYSEATSAWSFVKECKERYEKAIEGFNKREKITSELRNLNYWTPLDKTEDNGMTISRIFRS